MDILIRNIADVPIYEQIEKQIIEQILSGDLKPGDALPSMRVLAKDLKISIITTKRAYEDLEKDGYIESYTGKGSFVKEINPEYVKEKILYEIQTGLEEIVNKAKTAGISKNEIEELLNVAYEEE